MALRFGAFACCVWAFDLQLSLEAGGWLAGFLYVTAAALRLARFNIQTGSHLDKRYFVGMPTPAAASVVAATIYAWPFPLAGYPQAGAAVAVVLVPAALMVKIGRAHV